MIRHFIVSGKPPYKQRRSGIVQRRAPPHGDAVLIGVTIEASVPAGAVHADIHTRHTLAPFPLLRGTDIKAASDHPLDKLTAEATRVDDTGGVHGTPDWQSVGKATSSGCVRMFNQDVIDLYDRVGAKAQIVVI